jgi:hypothetical protein
MEGKDGPAVVQLNLCHAISFFSIGDPLAIKRA